jgi:hypothetical protein
LENEKEKAHIRIDIARRKAEIFFCFPEEAKKPIKETTPRAIDNCWKIIDYSSEFGWLAQLLAHARFEIKKNTLSPPGILDCIYASN